MLLNLRKYITSGLRIQHRTKWCFVVICLALVSGDKYVGDSCKMKSQSGVCKLASQCPELEAAVRAGTYSASDIVNCGFELHEEIICCPTNSAVSDDNRSDDDKFIFEHLLPDTTTTANPVAATKSDFWLHLLTTTTTAKPDFWLHLLNSANTTITTTTTTTTTTTPKPLIVNGKKVDTDADYIDLSSLLSSRNTNKPNNNGAKPNPTNRTPTNRMPTTVNQRAMGWQSPAMGIPNPTPNWNPQVPGRMQQNNGMPFNNNRQSSRNAFAWPTDDEVRDPRRETIEQPFVAMATSHAQAFNSNMQNQRPIENSNWQTQTSNRNWNGAQNWPTAPIFQTQDPSLTRPPLQWQDNNDLTQANPLAENIWPNSGAMHQAQSAATMQLPATNVFPNRPQWSNGNAASFDNTDDPIATINANLIKSGFDVVEAKLESVQRQYNQQQHEHFGRTTANKLPTQPSRNIDPFAPFQFRPQPEEDYTTNIVGESNWQPENGNSFNNVDSFQNPAVWNLQQSSSSRRPIGDDNGRTKPTVPITPTQLPVVTRAKDRPAVVACREIDAGLDPGLTPHILGGTPAEAGEFPHMAAIGYSSIGNEQGPYDYRCGGTLIAKRFVLTAAHCVNSRDNQPAVVLLGLIDLNDPDERRSAVEIPIRTVHIHPDYVSSSIYNDVAILELTQEVNYTMYVYPTCLYTDIPDPAANSILYVTGWGVISTKNRQRSNILLKAKLVTVPVNQCNQSYVEMGLNRRVSEGIRETQMCTRDPGGVADACQGDSGGPLNIVLDESLKKYRILGIISAGFSCGTATPGVYARVASYLDFIEAIVWPELA